MPDVNAATGAHVLMLHPHLGTLGGVQTTAAKLLAHYRMPVTSFAVGGRPGDRGAPRKLLRVAADLPRFAAALRAPALELVHVHASLKPTMFFREGIFFRMAKRAGKRMVLHLHGWSPALEARVDKHPAVFRFLFPDPDAIIVYAKAFGDSLRRWGCRCPIHVEASTIEDEALEGFDLDEALRARLADPRRRVLFLSRIVREKGIYETIEAVAAARRRRPTLDLLVTGDGPELEAARRFAAERGHSFVRFTGNVSREELRSLLRTSHLLCLPSYYGEGFPAAIPEAMAFGLPVVTRPVGGIGDVLRDGEHGFLTTSRDPAELADLLERTLADEGRYRAMARTNHDTARSRFLASGQAERFEEIYRSLLGDAPAAGR